MINNEMRIIQDIFWKQWNRTKFQKEEKLYRVLDVSDNQWKYGYAGKLKSEADKALDKLSHIAKRIYVVTPSREYHLKRISETEFTVREFWYHKKNLKMKEYMVSV